MTSPWLTINEVATYWRVSRRTVERELMRGEIRYILFGEYKRVRIWAADAYKKLPLPDENLALPQGNSTGDL